MNRFMKLAAAGGLLLTVSATPAQAACSNVYGGSSFGTCASADISTFYDAALNLTRVTVNFGNWGDLGEIFTAFGLHSFASGTTLYGTGNFAKSASLTSWELATSGAGLGDIPTLRYIANPNGVGGGLGNGQSGWFSFDLSGTP